MQALGRGSGAAWLVVGLALIATGCSASEDEQRPTRAGTPRASLSPGPTQTELVVAPKSTPKTGDLPLVDRRSRWTWNPVGPRTYASYEEGEWDADANYVLTAAMRGDRQPSVINRDGGEVITRITSRQGFHIEEASLSSPWLVWAEVEDEGGDRYLDVFGHVYNLETGRHRVINEAPKAQDPDGATTWNVRDNRLIYPIRDRSDRRCIVVLDLKTLQGRKVDCAEKSRQAMGFPRLSRSGLGFNHYDPERGRRGCSNVRFVRGHDLIGRPVHRVPAHLRCAPFTGAVGPGFVAWDEPSTKYRDFGPIYAKATGAAVLDLGSAEAASLTDCRGWLYWEYDGARNSEVRRWHPGGPVQIIYRSPGINFAGMTPPFCQRDRVIFVRSSTTPYYNRIFEGIIPRG